MYRFQKLIKTYEDNLFEVIKSRNTYINIVNTKRQELSSKLENRNDNKGKSNTIFCK